MPTTDMVETPPAPEQTPAMAVPSQHGFRPDQDEVASPVPMEAADEEPEEFVLGVEAGTRPGAEGNLELLA